MEAKHRDFGILIIRVVVGLIFISHGWDKWQHMNDPRGTVSFFASLGLSSMWAYLVATIELLGGLSVLFGVWHKWAGWLLAAVMAGAIYFAKWKLGFAGYQYELTLFAVAIGLALIPPGRYVAMKGKHHSS